MNLFYFRHLYTTDQDQSIEEIQEQCMKIGRNPLFITNSQSICGYIVPEDVHNAQSPKAPILSIMKTCATVDIDTPQDDSNIRLLTKNGTVVGWTFGKSDLPEYTAQPIDAQRIEKFGRFAPWIGKIATAAKETDCRVFMVGGAARDFVLDNPIQDIDFLVQGDVFPLVDYLMKHFGGSLHKETLFEAAHWTAPDGSTFDFTVARSEWYSRPATIPKTQKGTILDDIMRRDFSINSMLISIQESGLGHIIDATNGMQDIKERTLRILHEKSFKDDPTRIFRGARYAGRYELSLSTETKKAMTLCLTNKYIDALPYEQVGKEIQKIFKEEDPNAPWLLLHNWNIINHLFDTDEISIQPSLRAYNALNNKGICTKVDKDRLLWLTLIMQIPEKKYRQLTNVVKGGGKLWSVVPKLKKVITELPKAMNNAEIGSLLHNFPPESLIYIFATHPEPVEWWLIKGNKLITTVDGVWLGQEGCPKGPLFGEALRKAQHAAWMGYSHEEQRKIAKNVWMQ